ncbi:MAG: DUF5676 family membrane protein, partial [Thiolinea sp.]
LSAFTWSLTWANFFIGLVAWPSIGGVTAWLISSAYNRLSN